MIIKISLFVGLLAMATNAAATWLSTPQSIKKLNTDFEVPLTNGNFPKALIQDAEGFVTEDGAPREGITPGCLRLWMEGQYTALVARAMHPIQRGKNTLFLSGYGGNGATVFNIVKDRVAGGEICTLVLLPSYDGSRGNNGVIPGEVHFAYDAMEAEFRTWNLNLIRQAEVITITDKNNFMGMPVPQVFLKITAVRNALANLLRSCVDCAKDEECKAAYDVLKGDLQSHFDTIQELVKAELNKLKWTEFNICFEGHLGQGFDPLFTTVTYPVLDFLVNLPPKTIVVSVDYPVGWTEKGFQKVHAVQYRPNTMIVLFLMKSIVAKDNEGTFHLNGVQIVQINWNTVVSWLQPTDTYGCPPDSLVQNTLNHAFGFTYRTLLGMTTQADKVEWDKVVSAEYQQSQDFRTSPTYHPYYDKCSLNTQ